jgi:hypothetical protein
MLSKSHTRKGIGRPGRYGPENAARISLFHGEAWIGLQANHQRITNRAYVTKNRLVLGKLAKKPSKLLPGRDPVRARTSLGCPRLAGKPRTLSLVMDQEMNSLEVEGE